ncbi:MAG: YihY/virulence factor BrkB family protein [Chloroflexota bacterium]|nr:YihY/virulence factor BrkB family protein [Chloroflexota bacterium]
MESAINHPGIGRQQIILFTRVVLTDFMRNNCPYIAAGIAYWALFSLFPLCLVGISILSYSNSSPEEQTSMVEGIIEYIPVSADYLLDLVSGVAESRGTLSTIAIAGLLFSGTAVFSAVRKGINHAWHVSQPHYFFLERAIDILMLAGVGLLALFAAILSTNVLGLAPFEETSVWLFQGPIGKVFLETGVLAATFGILLLLYRYVPNTSVKWEDTWFGALIGALVFHGVRIGFSWYVTNFGNFNVVYGSLAGIMVLLLWVYLSAMALVLGAEIAYVYSRTYGSNQSSQSLSEFGSTLGIGSDTQGFRGFLNTVRGWLVPRKRDK